MNQQNIYRKYAAAGAIVFALNAAGTVNRISGATVATNDFKILRHVGGVWNVANPATTTPTEIGTSGLYSLPLTATELTPDDLQYPVIMAAHDVAGAEWDDVTLSIYLGYISADVEGWAGSAPNALISGRVDANAQVVADKTLYTLTTGEHTQVAADVLNATTAAHATAGSIGKAIGDSGGAANPWDMLRADHVIANSFGQGVASVQGAVTGAVASVTGAVGSVTGNVGGNVAGSVLGTAADSPGTTTLLSRITATRAVYLDLLGAYLDVAISAIRTTVNAIKASTDNLPADPASGSTITTAITTSQGIITTQTDLIKAKTVNLPSSPAAVGAQMDLVNAPNATAITAIQSGLATGANQTTILARLGAWTGTGRNTVLGALQSLFRKDADAVVPSDINVNLGSGAGTYANTTDSNEAIRDNMSAGGAAPSAADNANAVWDALRSAHVISGSFGQGGASIQGNVTGSVDSVTNAVGSVVGSIGGNLAGNVLGNVAGNVQGTVPDSSGVATLLGRLSNARAGYLDALAGWTGTLLNALKAMARKDASASADIGGTYSATTDSQEAISEAVAGITPGGSVTENIQVNELNV